jgi:hypothetical protein
MLLILEIHPHLLEASIITNVDQWQKMVEPPQIIVWNPSDLNYVLLSHSAGNKTFIFEYFVL